MDMTISERIGELRRERGLTQEQLGRLVGVSAQAVSKWEKGGAPDVELLPALADRLGVTVDGLFGREEGPDIPMAGRLDRWIGGFPMEERLSRLFRLLADVFLSMMAPPENFGKPLGAVMAESCYMNGVVPGENRPAWLRAGVSVEEGMVLGVLAEDMPLYLLLPEPPAGYGSNFATMEEYRRLFTVLSMEGALESLVYLYGRKRAFYTAAAVARRADLDRGAVEAAFAAMTGCHLLDRQELELEEGTVTAYAIRDNQGFVPFLYFARWFMEEGDAWSCGWQTRERPVLAGREEKEGNHGEE